FEEGKSYMLIANHTSMMDIMMMLVAVKNHPFVFVGKKELAKIPLFGFIYKRVCILVDRGNSKSRYQVFERAQSRIKQGLSICIFPEGGVPDDESIVLDEFKDGAFRIAIEHQLPIVPLVFFDNKKRLSYTFFSGSPGRMRAKI
ncbi:1-acyl-sn-glycerol-3-phosphate acyltransferase, partial [Flavobacterium sp. I-SCBP12n]